MADAAPVFVVQKHQASTLHYDLRLQVGDVLKSWAVPKGPSTDPREKRLAVAVDDHTLEHGDFEGAAGAGAVIIWDRGTYENLTRRDGQEVPIDTALAAGHVVVGLRGEKLRGAYALTRTDREGGRERWLLVKVRDADADAASDPVSTQPRSVVSGRTLEDLIG